MSKRIAITKLNASTIDILNTIRANAPYEYQQNVPEITTEEEIPKVGEAIFGYPAGANTFLNALINRIAMVRVNSATFNNDYAELKKGYLEFGETVEEVFVSIAKAKWFSVEKAENREFKRTLPDVRTAFHLINWRVVYPITIQNDELRMAFTSIGGVQDMIARIVDAIYTGANYDEFLLFKYLIIKAVTHGKMHPVQFDGSNLKDAAKAFRGMSNRLPFMSSLYNASGVPNTTPKERQYIFMDADFNAEFDVEVLASAFNMNKAEFMGKLKLVDSWTTFDNERFDAIRAESDGLEEVTAEELELMSEVKAVIVDSEWFQVYDNLTQFTEKFVASGLYWNYFYHTWKTLSTSPFSNAVVFVGDGASIAQPTSITLTVDSVEKSGETCIFTLVPADNETIAQSSLEFLQTPNNTTNGVAVHKYGAYIVPVEADSEAFHVEAEIKVKLGTKIYTTTGLNAVPTAGTTYTLTIPA